jgi:hypothetical protein
MDGSLLSGDDGDADAVACATGDDASGSSGDADAAGAAEHAANTTRAGRALRDCTRAIARVILDAAIVSSSDSFGWDRVLRRRGSWSRPVWSEGAVQGAAAVTGAGAITATAEKAVAAASRTTT